MAYNIWQCHWKILDMSSFIYATDCSHGTRCHRQDDINSQMYMYIILKGQIRLHKRSLQHLKDLLDSRGILSTGHLPPSLFALRYGPMLQYMLFWSTSHTQILLYRLSQYWTIWHGSSQFLVWALMAALVLTFLNLVKHHTGINKNWCATVNAKPLCLTMIKLIMISSLYVTLWTLPLGPCMSVFGISQADWSHKQLLVP